MLIGSKEVKELPLAHGNPYLLIGLAPGTTFEGDPMYDRPYEPGHIAAYSMGGSVAGATDITIDGVVNTYRRSAVPVGVAYTAPTDAIGEMRIETSSFDARAGQTSGGLINISIRSGTNKLRGSFNFTKMRPDWMANTWFGNRSGTPRGDFDYNRWGTSLSGPIFIPKFYNGRNRTFFMWSYEGLSDQRPRRTSTALTVPTPDQRKGDFSELLRLGDNYRIYNPYTRRRDTVTTGRYRISVQRQFGGSTMMEAAYVGNRSTKFEVDRYLNIVGNQLLSRSPFFDQQRVNYLSASIPNPFRGLAVVSGTMGTNNNISRENLLKHLLLPGRARAHPREELRAPRPDGTPARIPRRS